MNEDAFLYYLIIFSSVIISGIVGIGLAIVLSRYIEGKKSK